MVMKGSMQCSVVLLWAESDLQLTGTGYSVFHVRSVTTQPCGCFFVRIRKIVL